MPVSDDPLETAIQSTTHELEGINKVTLSGSIRANQHS